MSRPSTSDPCPLCGRPYIPPSSASGGGNGHSPIDTCRAQGSVNCRVAQAAFIRGKASGISEGSPGRWRLRNGLREVLKLAAKLRGEQMRSTLAYANPMKGQDPNDPVAKMALAHAKYVETAADRLTQICADAGVVPTVMRETKKGTPK